MRPWWAEETFFKTFLNTSSDDILGLGPLQGDPRAYFKILGTKRIEEYEERKR